MSLTRTESKKNPKFSTTEYYTWEHIKKRCLCKSSKYYDSYGGRGIKVCDRWLESFDNFLEDIGKKPNKNYSIERIDNNGDYCPENCKWASKVDQAKNRRNNVYLTIDGITLCQKDWSKKSGISQATIIDRLRKGFSPKEAVFNPKSDNQIYIKIDDEIRSISEWSKVSGVRKATIWARLNRGWCAKDAVFKNKEYKHGKN